MELKIDYLSYTCNSCIDILIKDTDTIHIIPL
jgi:hypothetical protein